ncbi:MAG TPA: HEXXH motif-containing putative peptide modification protein [Polyangiaceae bacterium LLY-WYZ-15_(1-7)]|nr:hypothetical protein [Myxococcales bacterium]MAT29462.1 hypothetical protein [Sandaracinus sp.]HJL02104.1 HEXXH motif-containing putative peptide modification protein [Polyangiaceae bacterium LLY-WYZ-15_(1-7)]HJL11904.1 HEXXH motif-containing putative peptide modification protein [Polyangiaceae bacterium LLY-WYZ-15_(1-7)]HJL21520.1 HEXXH motif-containing putative peptide modification protein [Polyangiaceae bacterium LLY-WYZ-15_(1-7)]
MTRAAFHPSPPRDLTIPDLDSTTARAVWSMALRKLFEDLKTLRAPRGASPAAIEDWRTFRRVVSGFLPGRPGAVASLLRRPVVSAPLRCLRDGATPADEAIAEVVGQGLFELALAGALDAEHVLRAPPPFLSAPHRDAHVDLAGAREVRLGPAGVRVDGAPATPTRGRYHVIADDVVLATVDNNPLRDREAHPDKQGNAVDLGGRAPAEWVDALRDALARLGAQLPTFRDEVRLVLQQVVPVGFDARAHLSASYREALGTIYLSLHPRPLTMVEALIHEVSHNKLNALLELDPLLHNAFEPLYPSPVRPDPRPLLGVLLAVHAFLPVARFYERLLAGPDEALPGPRAAVERRFEAIRAQNRDGAAVLAAHAEATPVGDGVLDEIARWTAHFA